MKLKNPIVTKTIAGYHAVVTGITNRPTDQLDGYVVLPKDQKTVCWDFGGRCRDYPTELNLDMRLPEHQVLRQPLPRNSPLRD